MSETKAKLCLGIPPSIPKVVKERGIKIFFNPTCQYCKYTNERIRTEVREANATLDVEEFDLWSHSDEALRRRITCVSTYLDGRPILPTSPRRFFATLKQFSQKTA